MDKKTCTKCGVEKELAHFGKRSKAIDGLQYHCKSCMNAALPPPLIIEAPTEGVKTCSACSVEKPVTDFYKRRASPDGLHPKCKICKMAQDSNHYKKNRKKIIAQVMKRVKDNPDAYNAYRRDLRKRKEATDLNYKLSRRLRSRLYNAVLGLTKAGSAVALLGCTVDALRSHLEASFYPHPTTGETMSWDNYGDWHIDHIQPLNAFDLADRVQLAQACHHTNLQPLWAIDNLTKGFSLNHPKRLNLLLRGHL